MAAVDPASRATDFAELLASDGAMESWLYRSSVVRDIRYPRGATLSLLTDHGTGTIDEQLPLALVQLWPDSLPRWAWGEDAFGLGGLGFDGFSAPGLGGAFGAGMFGIGADTVTIEAAIVEEAAHALVLRVNYPGGSHCDAPAGTVLAAPPPLPPRLKVIGYDADNAAVVLAISN